MGRASTWADWLKRCAGKVRHDSQLSADWYLENFGNRGQMTYECKRCGGIHIGTPNKKKKPKNE